MERHLVPRVCPHHMIQKVPQPPSPRWLLAPARAGVGAVPGLFHPEALRGGCGRCPFFGSVCCRGLSLLAHGAGPPFLLHGAELGRCPDTSVALGCWPYQQTYRNLTHRQQRSRERCWSKGEHSCGFQGVDYLPAGGLTAPCSLQPAQGVREMQGEQDLRRQPSPPSPRRVGTRPCEARGKGPNQEVTT